MAWTLVLVGVATAAVFLALPWVRWDMRRTLHRLNVEAVATLTREEDATEGLARQLRALNAEFAEVKHQHEPQGDGSVPRHHTDQPSEHHLYYRGSYHRSRRGYGPSP